MQNDGLDLHVDPRGVATLHLNRPQRHNAFDDRVIDRMTRSLESLANDPDVRLVTLTAAGNYFSAGADLRWMQQSIDHDLAHNLADARALSHLLYRLNTLPQITIARIHGSAFGGALGLISCCDIALCVPEARFALSEVRLGLIPATISPYVIAAIGGRAARRYFTTGESFSAERAKELGLVSELVHPDALNDRIAELIDELLKAGPVALREVKQLVARVSQATLDQTLIESTCEDIARIRISAEAQEGLRAFFEQRKPDWRE